MTKKIIVAILIMIVIGLSVWYLFLYEASTPIGKITENPRDYDGKAVNIAGDVTDRMSLIVVKYFTLKDKTGEIKVVSKRALPTVGSKIRIKGTIKEAFTIGDSQMLVLVEE